MHTCTIHVHAWSPGLCYCHNGSFYGNSLRLAEVPIAYLQYSLSVYCDIFSSLTPMRCRSSFSFVIEKAGEKEEWLSAPSELSRNISDNIVLKMIKQTHLFLLFGCLNNMWYVNLVWVENSCWQIRCCLTSAVEINRGRHKCWQKPVRNAQSDAERACIALVHHNVPTTCERRFDVH